MFKFFVKKMFNLYFFILLENKKKIIKFFKFAFRGIIPIGNPLELIELLPLGFLFPFFVALFGLVFASYFSKKTLLYFYFISPIILCFFFFFWL